MNDFPAFPALGQDRSEARSVSRLRVTGENSMSKTLRVLAALMVILRIPAL